MGCFATVAAIGATLTLAAAGDGHLTIGTESPFPPYMVTEADGSLSGFEFQLMQEVCKRQSFTCDWKLVAFEELVPGVMDGRFDVVLGGMAITEDRVKLVDFTTPYQQTDDTEWFVGYPDAPPPEGATISVQSGTLHEAYLRSEALDFRSYSAEADALAAVADGTTDLAFGPFEMRADLEPFIADHGLELLYQVPIGDAGTGMAVCKGNAELLDRLNAALDAMEADGTIALLESRWF